MNFSKQNIRYIYLTAGNLGNNHLYLSEIINFFPKDSLGESSKDKGLGKELKLIIDGLDFPVYSDIAKDKKIFRKRVWGKFFNIHQLEVGDEIAIEKIDDCSFHIYPTKKRLQKNIGYAGKIKKIYKVQKKN